MKLFVKKLLFFILIFSVVTFPALALAYTGQYPWDPLHVEVQPTQQYKNDLLQQQLISQYGSSAFYGCYACLNKDTSDPYTKSSCLSSAQYCLQSRNSMQQLFENLQKANPQNNETPDAGCKRNYGQYSYYVRTETSGTKICDCASGSEWNTSRTACVKVEKTPNEKCKETYGQYSYYSNNNCECMAGYVWNKNKTACEAIIISMKTNDELCQSNSGLGQGSIAIANGSGWTCGCMKGYKEASVNNELKCVKINQPALPAIKKPAVQNNGSKEKAQIIVKSTEELIIKDEVIKENTIIASTSNKVDIQKKVINEEPKQKFFIQFFKSITSFVVSAIYNRIFNN